MKMIFDEAKATQTAAVLLRLAGGKMNYVALIKHLYQIDREALRRWGVAVTTDHYASMKYGPVTSRILDLIKASKIDALPPSTWTNHIRFIGGYEVELSGDPGISELAPIETKLIKEVFEQDGSKREFDLAEASHRNFKEWRDPGPSSTPISLTEILSAVGASEAEVAHAENSIDIQRSIQMLGR